MALGSPRARLGDWMVLAYEGSRHCGRSVSEDAPPPYSPPPAAEAVFVSIDIGESLEAPPPYSPPVPRGEAGPLPGAAARARRAQRRAARRSRRRAGRRAARGGDYALRSPPSSVGAASPPALPSYSEALRDLPPPYDTVISVDAHDGLESRTEASLVHHPQRHERPSPSRLSRPPRVSSRELYRCRRAALVRESSRRACCSTLTHAHVILGVLLLVLVFLWLFLWH
ncbi:membrane protein UL56 [Macacine alphaherpesvirus 1]|nr:membrane protein UL56 [Macacine alphaherpesvirus 1]ARS02144.1 membrane protein UL56 [Macacine alphaherpesvirus 1]ARS02219.1 membrane protein UL56 [Macacine alphaherpesvirus 1]ARS02294.1 membrane protein UL56 [Macacine alphaherpesvirus 1]ARS02369.1 membrane protein UL56 [Macacine alphaherpesvirus 1]